MIKYPYMYRVPRFRNRFFNDLRKFEPIRIKRFIIMQKQSKHKPYYYIRWKIKYIIKKYKIETTW